MTDPREGAECDKCPLNGSPYVSPKPAKAPKLVILDSFPAAYEVRSGGPVDWGDGLRTVQSALRLAGGNLDQAHRTFALLCRPNASVKGAQLHKAVKCCRPRLKRELGEMVGPTGTLLALGPQALEAATGKVKVWDWLGSPALADKVPGYQLLPTLDLFTISMTLPQYRPVVAIHTARAWDMAMGKLPEWRWPEIVLDRNAITVREVLVRLSNAEAVGVDVETNPDRGEMLLNVGISSLDVALSVTWYDASEEVKALVVDFLETKCPPVVMQNGSYDWRIFRQNGITLTNFAFDTMVAHSIVAPELDHDLGTILAIESHAPRHKTLFQNLKTRDWGGPGETEEFRHARALYNAQDCYTQRWLLEPLRRRLQDTHRGSELFERKMREVRLACRMTEHGILVDQERLGRYRTELSEQSQLRLARIKEMAANLGFEDFAPGKKGALKAVFHHLGASSPRRSKKTKLESFDAKALQMLCTHHDPRVAKFAKTEYERRRFEKLYSAFVRDLPLAADGRVHPRWKPDGAMTGRWSCNTPNLQQIPKANE